MPVDTWQRYRDTLDSLLEGFQIIGYDWTYVYVNPAAARHGRRSLEELLGRRMADVYPGIEDTPLFATLKRCMLRREPTSIENLFTFPDNSSRWFEIRVEPVPEGLCVHSVDIQARKDAEALLREQESIAMLGHMAALVAHEVKNPLAGLSGALQVLRGRRPANDPEIAVIDNMLGSIRALDHLVRDLLVLGRPIHLQCAPVEIGSVIGDALEVVGNDACLTGHRTTVTAEEPSPVVYADRELLGNVFRNLLLNAGQAMPEPGCIDIRISHSGAMCSVTVADTGPGIPAALAPRIFEPFVSGRKAGTGLGLAISRRIARLHGGDVALLPAGGTGATFLVTVPLHAVASESGAGPT
jgi:PAS domain S-box-containing protein